MPRDDKRPPKRPRYRSPAGCGRNRHTEAARQRKPLTDNVVTCLGFGPSHTFSNDGTPGNRICPACRRKQETVPEATIRVCTTPIHLKAV